MPDSDVDAIVTVECLENHVLKGEAALTCRSDGTWSSEIPTCEEGMFIEVLSFVFKRQAGHNSCQIILILNI